MEIALIICSIILILVLVLFSYVALQFIDIFRFGAQILTDIYDRT